MNWMDRITAACKRFHYVISGAGTVLDIAGNNLQTPELELWAEARGLVCQCALHETNQYLMGITTKHLEWSNSLPEVKP